jgi:hypothetical protein
VILANAKAFRLNQETPWRERTASKGSERGLDYEAY